MTNTLETRIVRITQDPLLTALGGVTQRWRLTFMLGAHGPYSVTVDAAGFTAEKGRQAVEKVAVELRALLQTA